MALGHLKPLGTSQELAVAVRPFVPNNQKLSRPADRGSHSKNPFDCPTGLFDRGHV